MYFTIVRLQNSYDPKKCVRMVRYTSTSSTSFFDTFLPIGCGGVRLLHFHMKCWRFNSFFIKSGSATTKGPKLTRHDGLHNLDTIKKCSPPSSSFSPSSSPWPLPSALCASPLAARLPSPISRSTPILWRRTPMADASKRMLTPAADALEILVTSHQSETVFYLSLIYFADWFFDKLLTKKIH